MKNFQRRDEIRSLLQTIETNSRKEEPSATGSAGDFWFQLPLDASDKRSGSCNMVQGLALPAGGS